MATAQNVTAISTTEADSEVTDSTLASEGTGDKSRMRDFFRFGKKEEEKKKTKTPTALPPPAIQQSGPTATLQPSSPLASNDNLRSPASPGRNHPYGNPVSPRNVRSASPRTHSPASSMIFERNVQEDVNIPQASPSIPSHIITENHIPPALDATSEAITNAKLDPDSVEIVTHATHQPAAVTITGGGGHSDQLLSPSIAEESSQAPRQELDVASNYASLDSSDVRRLSFISFADVVHAEHELVETRRDSGTIGVPALGGPRSPSPMRSPVSSQILGTSPPTSLSTSMHEASPHRGTGDLNIETMRQALRKTGSGDLSAFRSNPVSAIGNDDGTTDRSFR